MALQSRSPPCSSSPLPPSSSVPLQTNCLSFRHRRSALTWSLCTASASPLSLWRGSCRGCCWSWSPPTPSEARRPRRAPRCSRLVADAAARTPAGRSCPGRRGGTSCCGRSLSRASFGSLETWVCNHSGRRLWTPSAAPAASSEETQRLQASTLGRDQSFVHLRQISSL